MTDYTPPGEPFAPAVDHGITVKLRWYLKAWRTTAIPTANFNNECAKRLASLMIREVARRSGEDPHIVALNCLAGR